MTARAWSPTWADEITGQPRAGARGLRSPLPPEELPITPDGADPAGQGRYAGLESGPRHFRADRAACVNLARFTRGADRHAARRTAIGSALSAASAPARAARSPGW